MSGPTGERVIEDIRRLSRQVPPPVLMQASMAAFTGVRVVTTVTLPTGVTVMVTLPAGKTLLVGIQQPPIRRHPIRRWRWMRQRARMIAERQRRA